MFVCQLAVHRMNEVKEKEREREEKRKEENEGRVRVHERERGTEILQDYHLISSTGSNDTKIVHVENQKNFISFYVLFS